MVGFHVGQQLADLPNAFRGTQNQRTLELQKPILGPDGQLTLDPGAISKEMVTARPCSTAFSSAGIKFAEIDGALLYVYARDESSAGEIEDDFSLMIADVSSRILRREVELVVVLPKVLQ